MEKLKKIVNLFPNDRQLDAFLAFMGNWVLERKAVLTGISIIAGFTAWTWDDEIISRIIEFFKMLQGLT